MFPGLRVSYACARGLVVACGWWSLVELCQPGALMNASQVQKPGWELHLTEINIVVHYLCKPILFMFLGITV